MNQTSNLLTINYRIAATATLGSSLYYYVNGQYTNAQAVTGCNNWHPNGRLTSVLSQAEQNFVYGLNATATDPKWLGGSRNLPLATPITFYWVDSSVWSYSSFQPGEPANETGLEYCLSMGIANGSFSSNWNDCRCTLTMSYVCKRPVPICK